MNLILWKPGREITNLRQSMDRLLIDSLAWPVYRPFNFFENARYQWMPVDIHQTDNAIVVKASMPGVKLDNLDISFTDHVLTIKGETKSEEENQEGDYFYKESFSGELCRSVQLPEGLDIEKAEAVMENGILTLTVPKLEEAKLKSIKVKAASPKKEK